MTRCFQIKTEVLCLKQKNRQGERIPGLRVLIEVRQNPFACFQQAND